MKPIKLIEYLLGNFIGDIISFLLTVGHKPLKNCQETANFHVSLRKGRCATIRSLLASKEESTVKAYGVA